MPVLRYFRLVWYTLGWYYIYNPPPPLPPRLPPPAGHSLGGGVTGLLGPYLRAQFPSLRCWAFAPPGGLMSPEVCLRRQHCWQAGRAAHVRGR